jgi:hypothetical protein
VEAVVVRANKAVVRATETVVAGVASPVGMALEVASTIQFGQREQHFRARPSTLSTGYKEERRKGDGEVERRGL